MKKPLSLSSSCLYCVVVDIVVVVVLVEVVVCHGCYCRCVYKTSERKIKHVAVRCRAFESSLIVGVVSCGVCGKEGNLNLYFGSCWLLDRWLV